MDTKVCKGCGNPYPRTREYFHKNGLYYRNYCKTCRKLKEIFKNKKGQK